MSEKLRSLVSDLTQMEATVFDRRKSAEERRGKLNEMKQHEAKVSM